MGRSATRVEAAPGGSRALGRFLATVGFVRAEDAAADEAQAAFKKTGKLKKGPKSAQKPRRKVDETSDEEEDEEELKLGKWNC